MGWGEKSLDRKLEKSCTRGSLDEKRQLERHEQTPIERQKARQQRNRKRQIFGEKQQEKRKPKRQHKKRKESCWIQLCHWCLSAWGCGWTCRGMKTADSMHQMERQAWALFVLQWSSANAQCARRGLIRWIKACLIYMLRIWWEGPDNPPFPRERQWLSYRVMNSKHTKMWWCMRSSDLWSDCGLPQWQ